MTELRAVFDTNVFLSGIIFGGNPRKCLDLVRQKRVILFTSSFILWEVAAKLTSKFVWSNQQVAQVIRAIAKISTLVKPTAIVQAVDVDPSDDRIIECAVAARVKYLVTGDQHLLNVGWFEDIEIVTPTEFIKREKALYSVVDVNE